MSAFFNVDSMITVLLFIICTCSFVKHYQPSLIEPHKTGFFGFLRRAAVIGTYFTLGDRLSPWVSVMCGIMAINTLFFR